MRARLSLTCSLALCALFASALLAAAEPPAAPSATPIKHNHNFKACAKQADTKKLSGAARREFLKSCEAGKGEKP
jgi:hypothetical protein